MYALLLNGTWAVGPLTNQPNPIQRNITSDKIQLFEREQTKYSNVSSNSSVILSLDLQV